MIEALAQMMGVYRERFAAIVAEMAPLHPEARFSLRDYPFGSGEFLGHTLTLDCWWPGRAPVEEDNVLLQIELCRLVTIPRLNADVCWSAGPIEAELSPEISSSEDWPEATPETFRRVADHMPELVRAFKQAVARGWPRE